MVQIPMYVCVCNGVTDGDIRQAAQAGCGSIAELTMRTGCGACCGSCVDMACQLLDEMRGQTQPSPRDNVISFRRISNAA
jgi:bacterioferritin-associated ferredoxin